VAWPWRTDLLTGCRLKQIVKVCVQDTAAETIFHFHTIRTSCTCGGICIFTSTPFCLFFNSTLNSDLDQAAYSKLPKCSGLSDEFTHRPGRPWFRAPHFWGLALLGPRAFGAPRFWGPALLGPRAFGAPRFRGPAQLLPMTTCCIINLKFAKVRRGMNSQSTLKRAKMQTPVLDSY